ncbi:MAG: hypothetical protein AVDCRST_MAG76-2875, partial [uncultured Acidimicrobiales bacterium]
AGATFRAHAATAAAGPWRLPAGGGPQLRRPAAGGVRPACRRASQRSGDPLLPDRERGGVGPGLHGPAKGAPAGRPRRRGAGPGAGRRLPLPHPHDRLPVTDRRGPGPRPGVALRAGGPGRGSAGGEVVPDRRRFRRGGAGRPQPGSTGMGIGGTGVGL